MCIGIATGTSPVGPFTHMGRPLLCGTGFVAMPYTLALFVVDSKSYDY